MAKRNTEKESLERLDEINLLWLFRQVSLGNLVRFLAYMLSVFHRLKECVKNSCARDEKESVKDEKAEK